MGRVCTAVPATALMTRRTPTRRTMLQTGTQHWVRPIPLPSALKCLLLFCTCPQGFYSCISYCCLLFRLDSSVYKSLFPSLSVGRSFDYEDDRLSSKPSLVSILVSYFQYCPIPTRSVVVQYSMINSTVTDHCYCILESKVPTKSKEKSMIIMVSERKSQYVQSSVDPAEGKGYKDLPSNLSSHAVFRNQSAVSKQNNLRTKQPILDGLPL